MQSRALPPMSPLDMGLGMPVNERLMHEKLKFFHHNEYRARFFLARLFVFELYDWLVLVGGHWNVAVCLSTDAIAGFAVVVFGSSFFLQSNILHGFLSPFSQATLGLLFTSFVAFFGVAVKSWCRGRWQQSLLPCL